MPNTLTEQLRPPGAPDADLLSDLIDAVAPTEDRWITDAGGAEWAMRKLAEAAAEIAAAKAQRDAYVEAADAWYADTVSAPTARAGFFEIHLAEWMLARFDANGTKSIKLPSGEITSRKVGGGWEVTSTDELYPWLADNHPALIEMRPHLLKSAANRALVVADSGVCDANGELVPGVSVVPETRSTKVSPYLEVN